MIQPLPAAVVEALRSVRHDPVPGPLVFAQTDLIPGEIRSALPMPPREDAAPRWVIILGITEHGRAASVALIGTDTDGMTDYDVRLDPPDTGAPFTIVVQTDLVAPVWRNQLGPAVGSVGPELLEQLSRAGLDQAEGIEATRRGLAVRGRDDSRWAYKQTELLELNALAANRIDALLGGEPPPIAEPVLIAEALSGDVDARLALGGTGRDAPTAPPADVVSALFSTGPVDPVAVFELSRLLNVTEDLPPSSPEVSVNWHPPSTRADQWRDQTIAACAHAGRRVVRLRTTPSLSVGTSFVAEVNGVRVQVDPDFPES